MPHSSNAENRVRLRILEIGLQPAKSKRAIKAELLIDGKVVNALATIEGGKPLEWDKLIICDAYTNSRVELAIHERHFGIYSQHVSESSLVSEMMGLPDKLLKINGMQYTAEIKILDKTQAEEAFAKSRKKLREMEGMSGAPSKLKAIQRMFKSMLEFGGAVAEINPIAKAVLAACTRAWEGVEEQQRSEEELEDLAGRLIGMASLVDEVKKHAQLEPLQQSIEDFLYLIEDVSTFVLERSTKGFVVRVLKSVVDSSDRDRVDELCKRFERISIDFEKGIGVQTMSMVTTAREAELLKRLNPVEPSGHDPSKACQEGTRLKVLSDIDNWIQDQNPSSTLMWIYGQAGIGKSTISASVCNQLFDGGAPAVSFFCKRDDPSLRDPLRLINSIAHGVAYRYPPYGKIVAKAIEANPELCTSHLGVRYEGLLKKPLCEFNNKPLPPFHVVLVDAMDECGTNETRRQLLGYLRELSLLVPWLRFVVTSRPNSDISSFFDKLDISPVSRCDLQIYPTARDIRAYIQVTVGDIAIRDEWPVEGIDKLCAKAGELFIWAATACKFITGAIDSQGRLRQLIGNSASTLASGLDELDSLYSAVIRSSITDQGADNISNLRRCIGAIVTISMKQPVPLKVLCELMREHVRPGVLREVVGCLGAVLYSDAQLEGAIRILHPSFADYALDQRRSGDFWVDPVQRNTELSIGCMSSMKRELRFNICELGTSYLFNTEVLDLNAKIDARITGQLAYSSIYWISHVLEGDGKEVAAHVGEVVDGPRLLYWLEVLSVLERVEIAVQGLRELSEWLKLRQPDLASYVWGAYRFVFAFSDPIIASAPHIYLSALPFSPRQSEVSRRLLPLFPNSASVVEGGDETWPEWLRSIALPARLHSMSTSRGSQRFVAGCRNEDEPGQTLVFDMRTGGLVKALKHSSSHDHRPKFVSISPDGTLVASVSDTAEVLLWEANTGAMVHNFQVTDPKDKVLEASFSPAGTALRLLVTTGERFGTRPTIIETGPRETINTPLPHLDTTRIATSAFSPDGACLALSHYDDRIATVITSWPDPIEMAVLRFGIQGSLDIIQFSPDGALVALAIFAYYDPSAVVQIWDVKKGTCIKSIANVAGPYSIAFSPGGTQMIAAYLKPHHRVQIFDLQTDGEPEGRPIEGSGGISVVAFSPDGAFILCGSILNTFRQISIWDASQVNVKNPLKQLGIPENDYNGHSQSVFCVLFSPDGTRIISGSYDRTLRIWDSRTRAPIGKSLLADSRLRLIAISPCGTRIMALTSRSTLYAWDASASSQLFTKSNIYSFALSPDGNHLVTAPQKYDDLDPGMTLWDANTGDIIRNINQSQSSPEFIAFSQTRPHVFSYHQTPIRSPSAVDSTGDELQVCIWDSTTYDVAGSWRINLDQYHIQQFRSPPQVHALSPNGDFIVSSYGSTIVIHDAYDGRETTEPLIGHWRDVSYIAFSSDGSRMASCSGFTDVIIWDPRSGVALGHLTTKSVILYSVALSPDGTKLMFALGESIFVRDTEGGLPNPWSNGDTSQWPTDTQCFPRHPTHHGWVSHDQKSLTFWLPDHYRRAFDPGLLYSISPSAIHIDFSRFAHGTGWTSVISKEALTYYGGTDA